MASTHDVVVIGAGPAGLMAAQTLAENGVQVALLERKTDIARVRRADGGAIGVNEYLYDRMVTFNAQRGLFCFPVDGFVVPYDGPYANIYGFQIYSPGKKRLLFGDWEEARKRGDEARVGVFISKEALLRGILDRCRRLGVEVFPNVNVSTVEKSGDAVRVTGSGRTFQSRLVIAADGVNSRTARILGFNRERKFKGTYRYLTWVMEGEVPIDPGSFNFILTDKDTFAVYNTCEKGLVHVSAFNSDTRADLRASLDELVFRDRAYAPWFSRCKKVEVTNCVSNILSPIADPFRDNVLIIGDAAWTMEFSNMASLCCGWKAGHAMTLALIDGKCSREGLSSYCAWWQKSFYGPYGNYDFGPAGGGGGILQAFLSPEELDYLVSLVTKPFPGTMNFFTLFNTIGSTYGELFPRIETERPEIMEKLFTIREKMGEIGEGIRKAGFPNR